MTKIVSRTATVALLGISILIAAGCSVQSRADAVSASKQAVVEKGPYLIYEGDPTSMTVAWDLDQQGVSSIAWGPAGGDWSAPRMLTGDTLTYECSPLQPGRRYGYEVRTAGQSRRGTFLAPAPQSDSLDFLVFGDTRGNSWGRSYYVPQGYNAVAKGMNRFLTENPSYQTLAVHVGDWTNGDAEHYWQNQFFNPELNAAQRLLSQIPIQGCRGNHEKDGDFYERYYPYPYVDDFYWSFDYGPAHFAVVDQYVDYSPGSAQYKWLAADLASTDKPWKFIILHEPGWSAGGHSTNKDVQRYIQPLCERYGVHVVLGGHNHYYARAVVPTEADPGRVVHHVTSGGGGAPMRTPDPDEPRIVAAKETLQFCAIRIDGDTLRFEAIGVDDQGNLTPEPIDSFAVTRRQ